MQVLQERERIQDQRRSRYRQMENALQRYIYQHAELRVGSKWGFIIGHLSVLPLLVITILLTFGLRHVVNNFALEDGILVLAFSIAALWKRCIQRTR